MIKNLLQLAAFLVVGILVYNYFLGTEEEQLKSKKTFQKIGELGGDFWQLLKAEKEKLDEGKYDEAIDKITTLLNKLKRRAEDIQDSGIIDQIAELEQKRKDLERRMSSEVPDTYEDEGRRINSRSPANEKEEQFKEDLIQLHEETEALMKKMEKE